MRILLPGVSDVTLVRHAGHGNYAALLAHGVRIFEYQTAVLHAKTLVADDFVSVAGSTNLDFRSFHFQRGVQPRHARSRNRPRVYRGLRGGPRPIRRDHAGRLGPPFASSTASATTLARCLGPVL